MNSPRGPRPHTWLLGPDPVLHAQHNAWLAARAQARFRGEPFEVTLPGWIRAWRQRWHQRGRLTHEFCCTRRDTTLPWRDDNIQVITRAENNRLIAQRRQQRRRRACD